VAVQSALVAEELGAYAHRRGLPERTLVVLPPRLEPTTSVADAKKAFAFQLFYPASPFPHKRVALAAAGAALATQSYPNVGLAITATPPDGPASPHVRWLGSLGADEVMSQYAAADALLFTSARETLGVPLLEALSAGLPAILPDLPYARAIYGDAGFYFPSEGGPEAVAAAISACVQAGVGARAAAAQQSQRSNAQRVSWAQHWPAFGVNRPLASP
jgi:glycosyltransferase involved in cell wall biosynthesis